MDQITITREEFRQAVADEITSVLESSEKAGASPLAGMMAAMLVTTFGAALTARLFNKAALTAQLFNKEEETEDGADS